MDAGLRMRHQVFSCLITIWLVVVCAAQAQTPPIPNSAAVGDTSSRPDAINESDLEIFWFKDKTTGELVPVSITLEELQELKLLKEQLIPRDPAPDVYVFQGDVGLTGTADEHVAQFTVKVNIRIRENSDSESLSWIRVPLRLNQTILMSDAYVGPGELLVSYDKQGDGYVAWLRAAPNSDHAITLNIKLPVVRVAGKLRVSLLTPQRPTRLQLEVPGSDLDVTTNDSEVNILT
ncbi:MAG: hypothetical protein QGF59_12375, partial [Pirellulaceae bacterium]|nr:hypothetical protein [Pirellulaceae bacterium]